MRLLRLAGMTLVIVLFVGCSDRGDGSAPVVSEEALCDQADVGNLYPILTGGKWGYIDGAGRIVIAPVYDYAGAFYEETATVHRGDSTSLITRTGKIIYTTESALSDVRSDDRIRFFTESPIKCGFVKPTGELAIEPVYEMCGVFSEGLALVLDKDGARYIDTEGNVAIDLRGQSFHALGMFSEGLAWYVTQEKKAGFINKDGNIIIGAAFDGAASFSEGLAAARQGERWGFIDMSGAWVVPPAYSGEPGPFVDGLAAAAQDGKWGYINRSGQWQILPQYDAAARFAGGLAAVKIGDCWGYADRSGNIVIKPKYMIAHPFESSLAMVFDAPQSMQWINREGEVVWPK